MQLRHIWLGDDPEAWRQLGFRVEDDGVVLARTVIGLDGGGGGFRSWWIDGVEGSVDGLVSVRPQRSDLPEPPPVHPNGIVAIDHVVIGTGDTRRTTAAFEAVGLELRRVRTATGHGSPVRQCFLWAGDVILELVGPDDEAATSDRPAGVLGLALVSEDLDRTASVLGPLMGTPKDAVQPGRRIAGLRGRELGVSLPLAVMSPHPG